MTDYLVPVGEPEPLQGHANVPYENINEIFVKSSQLKFPFDLRMNLSPLNLLVDIFLPNSRLITSQIGNVMRHYCLQRLIIHSTH